MNSPIPPSLKPLYPKLPYHNLAHTEGFDWMSCPSNEAMWAAIFHDFVYDPMAKDNEEKSLLEYCKYRDLTAYVPRKLDDQKITNLILSTKDHVASFDPNDEDMVWLHRNDLACFRANNTVHIMENEKKILREYQFVDFETLRDTRMTILDYYKKHPLVSKPKIDCMVSFLSVWEPKFGIFCGSFNPFHKGHYDVLKQAEMVFDKVIIAQGQNEDKETNDYPLDSVDVLKYHEKVKYDGSLFDFLTVKKQQLKNISVIRGLRNYHDLHDESGLHNFAMDYIDVPFTYFISKSENLHISSGAIRKLQKLGKNVQNYLP